MRIGLLLLISATKTEFIAGSRQRLQRVVGITARALDLIGDLISLQTKHQFAIRAVDSLEVCQGVASDTVDTFRVGRFCIEFGGLVFSRVWRMTLQAYRVFARLAFYSFLEGITHYLLVKGAMDRILERGTVRMHGARPLLVDILVTGFTDFSRNVMDGFFARLYAARQSEAAYQGWYE